jgi:lysophospholipase L1-like esterase
VDEATPAYRSYAAIGDSFTEGLDDPAPGGGYRGWADRLAGHLALHLAGQQTGGADPGSDRDGVPGTQRGVAADPPL